MGIKWGYDLEIGAVMARPALPVGTYGKIRLQRVPREGPLLGYRARTQVRDSDGRTRPVERSGRTKATAENRLKTAIRDRIAVDAVSDEITGASKVDRLAEKWFTNGGSSGTAWAATTTEQYRRVLDRNILPRLGGLEIRSLTTGRCDTFLAAIAKEHGASSAKMTRSVLSGMASLACRHDALPHNPVRDVDSIRVETEPAKAFTVSEARQILALVTYDDRAVSRDLPDLIAFMFATSLRLGEAIAFEWVDVDLDAVQCNVTANTHRLKGKGLVRNVYPNSKLKHRTLGLPAWAVEMLRRRKAARGGEGLVFPAVLGGLRDPSNTGADLRDTFAFMGLAGAKSHMFRKTGATLMDDEGRSPRNIADQLGHNQVAMSQNRYVKRDATTSGAAAVLEALAFAD
jgi:integrase